MEEIKDLQKGIQEILVAVGKIETELKHLSHLAAKQADTERSVIIMEQNVIALHTDVNEVILRVNKLEQQNIDDKKTSKEDKKWLIAALPGMGSFIIIIWRALKGG
jgi:hypothetical protein